MRYIIPLGVAALLGIFAVPWFLSHPAHAQGLYGLQQGWMQADQLRYHLRPQFWDQSDANGVQPLPIIPPLGARSCSPIRVCDGYGTTCVWQQVCR